MTNNEYTFDDLKTGDLVRVETGSSAVEGTIFKHPDRDPVCETMGYAIKLNREQSFTLLARDHVAEVLDVWMFEAENPEYTRQTKGQLAASWPRLYNALVSLEVAQR